MSGLILHVLLLTSNLKSMQVLCRPGCIFRGLWLGTGIRFSRQLRPCCWPNLEVFPAWNCVLLCTTSVVSLKLDAHSCGVAGSHNLNLIFNKHTPSVFTSFITSKYSPALWSLLGKNFFLEEGQLAKSSEQLWLWSLVSLSQDRVNGSGWHYSRLVSLGRWRCKRTGKKKHLEKWDLKSLSELADTQWYSLTSAKLKKIKK